MNRRRTLPLVFLCLALLSSTLACALRTTEAPVPEEDIVAMTVQAVLAAGGTQPPLNPPPTDVPPTEPPPTVEISLTPTLTPTSTATPTQTPAPTPCDAAQFVTDVTIPDDSDVTVNAEFVKTWRLRNVGTCTWTSGYQLVFDHGDRMSAPDSVMLTSGTVPPGSSVDVSVTLKAPAAAGTYQGFFKLRNPSSVLFGIGANANTAFWVKIEAVTFLLLQPLPVFPLLPIIQSSGTDMGLPTNNCFDLDAGSAVACSSGAADFKYLFDLLTQDAIDPRNSLAFSARFTSEPSFSDCKDAGKDTDTFDPSESRWYCFKTADDNYGWIKVKDTDIFALVFDWATW